MLFDKLCSVPNWERYGSTAAAVSMTRRLPREYTTSAHSRQHSTCEGPVTWLRNSDRTMPDGDKWP